MPPPELDDSFHNGRRPEVLPFVVDDGVCVSAGAYPGKTGCAVVPGRSGEEPRHLVESADGTGEARSPAALAPAHGAA